MTENITDDGKELFTGLESLVKKTNQIINFTNTPIYNLDNRLDSNQNDHLVSSSDWSLILNKFDIVIYFLY